MVLSFDKHTMTCTYHDGMYRIVPLESGKDFMEVVEYGFLQKKECTRDYSRDSGWISLLLIEGSYLGK